LLLLVLAEASLETIPKKLWSAPSVKAMAKRRGKAPGEMLLDRSYHHRAMKNLPNAEKRGRPDIVHFCLLTALSTPLNREGQLKVYVHTINDQIIDVDPKVRLPRNYPRFVGLMEQLFKTGRVPPKGPPLLQLREWNLEKLIEREKPDHVVALTSKGELQPLDSALGKLAKHERLMALVGGFPHGEFSQKTLSLAQTLLAIDPEPLDSWTVVARLVYEYERATSIAKSRLQAPRQPQ